MKFEKAIEALRTGKKMRLRHWRPECYVEAKFTGELFDECGTRYDMCIVDGWEEFIPPPPAPPQLTFAEALRHVYAGETVRWLSPGVKEGYYLRQREGVYEARIGSDHEACIDSDPSWYRLSCIGSEKFEAYWTVVV